MGQRQDLRFLKSTARNPEPKHLYAADEFAEICSLTNPTVKKKLLMDFADECDSAVVHLKAAALPRQSTQVILPLTAMKETEIYAPNYRDGEKIGRAHV